jgi:hypothetical protein
MFLAGAASLACLPAFAQDAEEQTLEPLVIRPSMEGLDPRYVGYATVGDFNVPAQPATVSLSNGRVVIMYPRLAEKARLVVFSHQVLADPLSYRNLLSHWASHGFVVVAPVHRDAVVEQGGAVRKSVANGVSEWELKKLADDDAIITARTEQCAAVLEEIDKVASAIKVEIVTERPVIAGHGLGAYSAQLLLGADVSPARPGLSGLADPRFFSGILMSPQGPGAMGLTESSWQKVAAPLLVLIAEGDRDFNGQAAAEKWGPYAYSKPGYKHLGVLKGGGPNTFVGQASGPEAKLLEVIKAQSTGFLLAYANYDQAAFADVSSGFFQRMSLGLVKESKR